ncbi:kynureninase [Rhodococcus aerolatus]
MGDGCTQDARSRPRSPDAAELDAADPLAHLRDRFVLPEGVVYLDGNSLGAMPVDAPAALAHATATQWGQRLIGSWNATGDDPGWVELPGRAAAALAPLLGADPDEVLVTDSTTRNLQTLLLVALRLRPGRRVVVMERRTFPTDVYAAQGVVDLVGGALRLIDGPDDLPDALRDDVAVLAVTEVDFRTGYRWDVAAATRAAHDAGALALVDLCHSTGALEVDLHAWGTDLAVGCGYKFLNGGPGAPAHLYVARALHDGLPVPLPAWWGHDAPFAMSGHFTPAPGVQRLAGGTPPVLSLVALLAGLRSLDGVSGAALGAKATALTAHLLDRLAAVCPELEPASPREDVRRGAQVSVRHPAAWGVVRALAERGVVGDFREPDVVRLGLAPAYTRFADVEAAVAALRAVLDAGEQDDPRWATRPAVT